jgi:hypothetical protein
MTMRFPSRPSDPASSRPRPARLATTALSIALFALLSGCSVWQPPQPWEKDILARPAMKLDDDPLARQLSRHIYTSKEAPSGGASVGGGGCGCN